LTSSIDAQIIARDRGQEAANLFSTLCRARLSGATKRRDKDSRRSRTTPPPPPSSPMRPWEPTACAATSRGVLRRLTRRISAQHRRRRSQRFNRPTTACETPEIQRAHRNSPSRAKLSRTPFMTSSDGRFVVAFSSRGGLSSKHTQCWSRVRDPLAATVRTNVPVLSRGHSS
jgi:hypothetical protein